ncbi:MAG: hypothetical protein Phog2KO_12540 [Phototrophicaceae bacterium]
MDTSSLILIGMIGGSIAGGVVGLFPLSVGIILNYKQNGIVAFICSIIAGAILGLIAAVPVSLGFTIYIAKIVKKERKSKTEAYQF